MPACFRYVKIIWTDVMERTLRARYSRLVFDFCSIRYTAGYQMTLYQMSFNGGIYVWQDVSTAYLPRDHYDNGCTLQCLQLLRTFKVMADSEKLPESLESDLATLTSIF